jgi:hypothetical protein
MHLHGKLGKNDSVFSKPSLTMKRFFFLAYFLTATTAAARLAWSQTNSCTQGQPAGGNLCLAETAVNAGGSCMKDTAHPDPTCSSTLGLKLVSAIGRFSTPMSGGALKLWPGVIAAVIPAAVDVSAAHAFPTPFMPSQGHTNITFSALPADVTIKIFTVSGHLVKTLTKSDPSDRLVWSPVANEQGSNLASGVYIFIVTASGGGQKKGKIMIIR